jgi:hypothetical protein
MKFLPAGGLCVLAALLLAPQNCWGANNFFFFSSSGKALSGGQGAKELWLLRK